MPCITINTFTVLKDSAFLFHIYCESISYLRWLCSGIRFGARKWLHKWLQNQADLMAETMILSQKLEDNQTLAIYFFCQKFVLFYQNLNRMNCHKNGVRESQCSVYVVHYLHFLQQGHGQGDLYIKLFLRNLPKLLIFPPNMAQKVLKYKILCNIFSFVSKRSFIAR